MPWNPKDVTKHNKAAKGSKGKQWAKVANKVLKQSGDEGKAVRIANASIKNKRTKS